MTLLVVGCMAVGLVYGRLPAAVAARVFRSDNESLLVATDGTRPFAVAPGSALATAVQILVAILLGGTAAVIGDRWVLVAYLWFVALTVTLTITDLDRKLIPNRILYPGFVIAGVLLSAGALLDGSPGALARSGLGAAAFFGFLLVLALVAGEGFGMGDVKLGALLGGFLAYEGWAILIVGSVGAFVLGGAMSVVLLALRIKGRKDAIPFGPYLVLGAYVALVVGDAIADWYTG